MERIGFMFAGQGAQYAGMGKTLVSQSPAARAIFEQADEVLGYSISSKCFEAPLEELTPCAVCQPAIFTVSMACMAAYLEEFPGFEPVGCGGLSLGEFSAACAAGIFQFATGLRLVAERGRLMDKCCQEHPGSMAAVLGAAPEAVAQIAADCGIDIANYNCPGQIVISGTLDGLDKASGALAAQGFRVVRLTVAGAYHSRVMQPAADAFRKVLEQVELKAPICTFVQNVPGDVAKEPDQIRENLCRQVSSSVRWEQCARILMSQSDRLLEFGPGNVLSGFFRRIDRKYPVGPAFQQP